MSVRDDPESVDASEPADLDVTPRAPRPTRGTGRRGARTWAAAGILVLAVGALGVVVFNGLNDAATFYYDVDEALERQGELGEDRFRMQGNVVPGTIVETDVGVDFTIAYRDGEVPVRHVGDPPELFNTEIPIIIEGSFTDDGFASDEILIRHDATYEEENDARLRDARQDAERRASEAG